MHISTSQARLSSLLLWQDSWTDQEALMAISLIHEVLGGAKPSSVPDLMEKIKANAMSDRAVRRSRTRHEQLNAENRALSAKLNLRVRLHYLRWFALIPEDLDRLINEIFGQEWIQDPVNEGALVRLRSRTLNTKDQWKSRTMERMREHVIAITKDDSLARTSDNVDGMKDKFKKTWDLEKFASILYWANTHIDILGSKGVARNFLMSEY